MSAGIICSACGFDNIAGSDACEQCNQSLTDAYITQADSGVERSIFDRSLLELNPRPAETVEGSTSLAEVISRLKSRNYGCVLITGHGGELVGIFTERDVLLKVAGLIDDLDGTPVERLMTPGPTVLRASDPISRALHLIGLHGFRHVPIVDEDNRPVGFISFRDIVLFMESSFTAS